MITDTFKKNCTSIKVPNQPKLLKIRDIQHLYTPVEGHIKWRSDNFTACEAFTSDTST